MDLNLAVKQSQTLSPQMLQSIKVLQMGSQELLEYISDAVQENPVLDASEVRDQGDEFSVMRKKLEWLDASGSREEYHSQRDEDQEDDPLVNYGGVEGQEEDLYRYTLSQLQAMDLPEELMMAAQIIVESLDGRGYLDESLDELAEALCMSKGCMEQALRLVQSLEPAGIGARDLVECLCIQLERRDERYSALAKEIVKEHLEALAKQKYHLIAKELSAELEDVRKACDLIRCLDPKPGSGFATREQVRYIVPDLFVETFPDHLELTTNDHFFPSLKISSYYKGLMDETQDTEVKEYLTNKIRQAKWVVKSIEQRRSTLVDCAECIMETQEAFFRRGGGHLVPMGLSDVAEKLGIHGSTVSRAIKDKYIQCSHGVYPLSHFFSRNLGGDPSEGSVVSSDGAKALLKKLIGEENRKKPLSDQALCDMMSEQGYPISRRTVAKYRTELGITSASGRKSYE